MVHIHADDKSKVSCYMQLSHTAFNRALSITDCDSQMLSPWSLDVDCCFVQ